MQTISSEEVQQHLPELIVRMQHGEAFAILHGGALVGRLEPIPETVRPVSDRLGLLAGRANVPANWKSLSREEIEASFYGE